MSAKQTALESRVTGLESGIAAIVAMLQGAAAAPVTQAAPAVPPAPIDPLTGRPSHPAYQGSSNDAINKGEVGNVATPAMVPLTGGTIDDNEYPINNSKTGKAIKVPPAYRKLFKTTAPRLDAAGLNGTLTACRFSTGSHGVMGEVSMDVVLPSGHVCTLSGNIILSLKDVTPPRK